ncbi:MAG TPA: hypothetical protein VGJ15_10635 [Pirellulales bacterium]|jgi:hypothetical protein
MKTTFFAAVGGALAAIALVSLFGHQTPAFAQRAVPYDSQAELIALPVQVVDATHQQLTLIDPRARVLSIYHVDTQSGAITLKSVRNIYWDLQLVEFNGTNPLPREIRGLLETR